MMAWVDGRFVTSGDVPRPDSGRIAPFETMNNRIPADLQQLAYDDPRVIERFKGFIDWVYQATEGLDVVAITLGNEFDLYLTMQALQGDDRWDQFESMVAKTRAHVKSLPRWRAAPFSLEATRSPMRWQGVELPDGR